MSRFTPINMAALPPLDVVSKLDVENELANLKADLLDRADAVGLDLSDVINLETDPLVILLESVSERITQIFGQANDQIRALFLAWATGPQLDHIAATYYGIARLVVTPADDTVTPPVDEVLEADENFRARIALAPEAFSTAGPEGAYIFHTLELDGTADISDVAAYSEDDGATYTDGPHADAYTEGLRAAPFDNRATGDPVLSPEVLLVVLPTPAYGDADAALLSRTYAASSRKDVRPIGDNVRIESAMAHNFEIEVILYFDAGPSPAEVIATAQAALETYLQSRRRIGARMQRIGIAAALKVEGVQEIDLVKPAADIEVGSKGYARLVGAPVITAEVLAEGWRS